MDTHKAMNVNKFRIPTTKHLFKKGSVKLFFWGEILQFINGECREMGRENKEVGAMPTCYCLTFMCCQPCLINFQSFQSCVS